MRPPSLCTVRDWFTPCTMTATLTVWTASWWLIGGLLCGAVVLVVAWRVVWRDDE